jgi:hypothetical protein
MSDKKPKEKEPKRAAGPKFQSPIPEGYEIRRPQPSPMADILREAESDRSPREEPIKAEELSVPAPQRGVPTSGTTGTGGTSGSHAIAPARDFMRVANSIHREAVPAGLFKGKSKQTYDYLYSRTRGAIVPTRTVQASWREIMKGARIGSDKTLREHLKHLRGVGLVTWEWEDGSQGGSVYTVYMPEEATGTGSTPGTGSTSGQFSPVVPPVENTPGTASLNSGYQTTSEIPKTLIKTNTNTDDEALPLSDHNSILIEAAQKLTGRAPRISEREQWAELARTLVEELNDAASRAESVSSVPAFLSALEAKTRS